MLDGVAPALHPWHMLGQPGAAAAAQPQMAPPAVAAAPAVVGAPDEGGDGGAQAADDRGHGVAVAARDAEPVGAAGSTVHASSASGSSAVAPAASVENEGSLERILEVLNELVHRVGALELAVASLRPS